MSNDWSLTLSEYPGDIVRLSCTKLKQWSAQKIPQRYEHNSVDNRPDESFLWEGGGVTNFSNRFSGPCHLPELSRSTVAHLDRGRISRLPKANV